MSAVEKDLLEETLKWIKKAEEVFSNIDFSTTDPKFAKNIKAYIEDSKYFLEKRDLIKGFECIIWAWAWIEIGEEVGLVRLRERNQT